MNVGRMIQIDDWSSSKCSYKSHPIQRSINCSGMIHALYGFLKVHVPDCIKDSVSPTPHSGHLCALVRMAHKAHKTPDSLKTTPYFQSLLYLVRLVRLARNRTQKMVSF